MRVGGVLLAAGLSRRFGVADKLSQLLGGEALGLRAARAVAGAGFDPLIAVTGPRAPDYAALGYAICRNLAPERGQGRSLALGVGAARRAGAEAVLIALADMPFVAAAHLRRVVGAARGAADARVASVAEGRILPPALFGTDWFDRLEALDGDRGARALLEGALLVPAPEAMMRDIDTPADLDRAQGEDRG